MIQTMDNNADGNAATQTTGDDTDNDKVPQCRQRGDATTSPKRVVVALVRARAVAVALVTGVVVAVARLVVVVATVMVLDAAARLVAVDLYISGRMLGSKENHYLMSPSSPFVIVDLVLLNDACRKEKNRCGGADGITETNK
jgi:hypothetical protein